MGQLHPALIVGAGPSGLSVAACLRKRGIDAVLLEREEAVGSSWRRHYRRLHLHTVKRYSTLPHHPWPADTPTYPSRQQVVDYLESYEREQGLHPRFGQQVQSARYLDGAWTVRTHDDELRARCLVVATGYNHTPHLPDWPGRDTFAGELIHSSAYRDGRAWRGKRALVVGSGNSGAEIAIDLWEYGTAYTAMCIRGPIHIMQRDPLGAPGQVSSVMLSGLPPGAVDRIALPIAERALGDLRPYGIRRPDEGPITLMVKEGRVPLLDIGTVQLIKEGHIEVVPGIERFEGSEVVFVDGRRRAFDLVVLATGYRAALQGFVDDAADYVDDRGYPRWYGEEASTPGLYFVGFRNPPIGQLHDIAQEAVRVADAIATSHV